MENESQNVVITDIKMPFFSMITFMVKWALASIPAVIIIGIIFGALWMGLNMVLGMLGLEGMLGSFMPPPQ
jgi:vacuolar-type H+-ATPase subunit I/STV1